MVCVADINKEIEQYRAFDEPIPFKGLLIKPIKAKDYYKFMSCLGILNIEKNRIPDIRIIQMSYLQFVFELILNDIEWRKAFIDLMQLCFDVEVAECDNNHIERGAFWNEIVKEDIVVFHLNGYSIDFLVNEREVKMYIKGIEIDSNEFNDISRYIQFQNIYDYYDDFMSDDVREVVEKFYAMKNKGMKPPTFEDKLVITMSKLGKSKKEMGEMSMLTIEQVFNTTVNQTDYIVKHIHHATAMTDKPLPDIEHWAFKSNKERFADVFVDAQTFEKNSSV